MKWNHGTGSYSGEDPHTLFYQGLCPEGRFGAASRKERIKMKKQRTHPTDWERKAGRHVRRTGAGFLVLLAAALLAYAAHGGRLETYGAKLVDRTAFSKTLLRMELGYVPEGVFSRQMNRWERMVLSQSAVLQAGEAAVSARMAAEKTPPPAASALPEQAPSPVPETSPSPTPAPTSNAEVIAKTLQPIVSTNYDQADGVYIFNRTSQRVNVAELSRTRPDLHLNKDEGGPQVLIMHTHGSEAYHSEGEDQYTATGEARTTDINYNVVRVGNELEKALTENGVSVIHDTTLYDYPSYKGSYERSVKAVRSYLEQYPSIRVVLDIHRDALVGSDGTVYKPVTNVNGQQVAQMMIVLGSDDGGLPHPNWKENVRFAIWLQKRLNADYPTLARPMSLRTSRYNQQLSTGSLLIEIGSHGNALQEALGTARLLGASLSGLLNEWAET